MAQKSTNKNKKKITKKGQEVELHEVCNSSQIGSKRRRTVQTDSESENEIIQPQIKTPDVWPRFLVLKPKDENKSFTTVSPFAISKAILGIAGETKSIKKLGNGELMVEVLRKSQSDNILNCKTFIDFPITASPHRSLNSSRGIIRHKEFKYCTEEEVKENLSSKGVTKVQRILVTRDGKKSPTNTFILTFDCPTVPSSIKIAYFNVPVEPYVPNPLRCFRCQRFGHHKDKCRCKPVCARCGGEGHEADGCVKDPSCVNCKGNHFASDKNCPKWISEKEIQQLRFKNNIPYPEARKMVEARMPSGQSYASIAATMSDGVKSMTTSSTQTEFIQPFLNSPTPNVKPPNPPKGAYSGCRVGPANNQTGSILNQPVKSCPSQGKTGPTKDLLDSKKSPAHHPSTKESPSKKSPSSKGSPTTDSHDDEPSSSRGKSPIKGVKETKKIQRGSSKPPLPPKPEKKKLLQLTNRFSGLDVMDTSDPITSKCIPQAPTKPPHKPILPP